MIEEKEIEFDTVFTAHPISNVLSIVLTPASFNPNTLQANLNNSGLRQILNNVVVQQADLAMVIKNGFKDLSFDINDDGELVINGPDADNYSLDADGNLIYTYR